MVDACAMHAPPAPAPTSSFRAAPSALNREAADLPEASASASAMAIDTAPTEIVIRPHGLRHGKWEAPAWAFWTIGAAVLALAIVYAFGRLKKKTG